MSRTLAAEEFKEQCLEILDHVGPEGVVITKHGRPVAKLVPIEGTSEHLIGSLQGKLRVVSDVTRTGVKWDAES